jgi:hypothetical protein
MKKRIEIYLPSGTMEYYEDRFEKININGRGEVVIIMGEVTRYYGNVPYLLSTLDTSGIKQKELDEQI